MIKKRKIAILSIMCLLFTLVPVISFGGGGITISLTNGNYNSTFEQNYGEIYYSTNDGAEWKKINDGTTEASSGSIIDYTVADAQSLKIKVSNVNSAGNLVIKGTPDQVIPADNPVTVTAATTIEFISSGGGNGGDGGNTGGSQTTYQLTLTAGSNGVIDSPSPVTAPEHSNQFISIVPDFGYEIATITVDGSHPLDANQIDGVNRNGGFTFKDITANHSLDVTFKAMNPAPAPFDRYDELKTKVEQKIFAYSSITDAATAKTVFCNDLWDIINHEYPGAFVNKAALLNAVTVTSSTPLATDDAMFSLSYYSFSLSLPESVTVSGKIYSLGDNQIIVILPNGEKTSYKLATLTPKTNPAGPPSFEDLTIVENYDVPRNIQVAGGRIENTTGSTNYCASFHISKGDATFQLFVYKPGFKGVIAQPVGAARPAAAWNFGNTPFVAFNGSTPDNPFPITTFFGNNGLTFEPPLADMVIDSISCDLPTAAVSINGKTITFNSNYYDTIPVTVNYTYNGEAGTAYVLIKRVGIDIQQYQQVGSNNSCQTNHGTQPGIVFPWGSDDCAIYATYYYPNVENTQIDLYCTYTWADGSVTTSLLTENVQTRDNFGYFTDCDDFCVYKGSKANKPVSVSIIAVNEGAFGASSFGGATLGAGAGVTWNAD